MPPIVCADRALGSAISDAAGWRSGRVRQVLPPRAVGAWPRVPIAHESLPRAVYANHEAVSIAPRSSHTRSAAARVLGQPEGRPR